MSALRKLAAAWSPATSAKHQAGPIGIDLALERMHMVQLSSSSESDINVKAQASIPYPGSRSDLIESESDLTALLRSALRNSSFTGRRAVVALPGGRFRTMSVAYQLTPGQSEVKILKQLMQDRLDGDLSDYAIDFIPIRTRSRGNDRMALVAASPRDMVISYLEAFRKAGLTVDALEIGPLSIRRLINSLPGMTKEDNVVVVNTGLATSYVTVLAGRRLLSDQDFRFGEDALLEQLSSSLDMSVDAARNLVMRTGLEPLPQQDKVSVALNVSGVFNTLLEIIKPELMKLVTEIERAVLYTASETHGGTVSRVYLVGALTRWRGVDSALNRILGLEVANLGAPLHSFNEDDDADGNPEIAVAAGLALRGLVNEDG